MGDRKMRGLLNELVHMQARYAPEKVEFKARQEHKTLPHVNVATDGAPGETAIRKAHNWAEVCSHRKTRTCTLILTLN